MNRSMNSDDDFDGVKVEVRSKFSRTISNWFELREVRSESISLRTNEIFTVDFALTSAVTVIN